MRKKGECKIVKHHRFLWWKWDTTWYEHVWEYRDTEHRFCRVCGRKELYLGEYSDGVVTYEDWRLTK